MERLRTLLLNWAELIKSGRSLQVLYELSNVMLVFYLVCVYEANTRVYRLQLIHSNIWSIFGQIYWASKIILF